LQAVDVLTGAVNTGYLLYFNPNSDMQMAKKLATFRMASILGWDQLAYDTRPNNMFNIWHFPIETRAIPDTRDIVPNFEIPNVGRAEYEVITGSK